MRIVLLLALVAVVLVILPSTDPPARWGGWSLGVSAAWAQEEDGEEDDDDDDDDDEEEEEEDDDDRRRPTRDRDRTPLFGDDDEPEPAPFQTPVVRPEPAPVPPPSPIPRPEPAPEVVVAVPDAGMLDAVAGTQFSLLDSAPSDLLGVTLARFAVPGGMTRQEAEAELSQLLPEALVADNTLYRTQDFSCSDAGCDAFEAVGWSAGSSCPVSPRIAMIDTGIDSEHPAFPDASIEEISVLGSGREPAARAHGTAVALLLVGRPDTEAPGLLPQAELWAAEAFHRGVFGDNVADVFDVVRAMDRLSQQEPDVMTLSFAGADNPLLARAVEAVIGQGISIVAAVGNGGPQADPTYPAAYPDVVGVTAVGSDDTVFGQAGQGAHVDLSAPGVGLSVAAIPEGQRRASGTSYATPIVAAAAALEVVAGARNPEAVSARLVARAHDLGAPGEDPVFGHGLVRLRACPAD